MSSLSFGNGFSASQARTSLYSYRYPDDDLGAVYRPPATTIKLWAPTAETVAVALFDDATSPSFSSIPMERDTNGIWSATIPGNLDGKYYLYQVALPGVGANPPTVFQVNDPYARGCSANTGRTLIYDPVTTNPEGWDQDQFVSLTITPTPSCMKCMSATFRSKPIPAPPCQSRKYLGMVEEGAKTPGGGKSGIDHLAELGITHVHLLPVNDYAGGDERQKADEYTWYDWGYDPVLFSTPEGSYASDPDGPVRQNEFKRMIQSFHRHHIGVVLDVVFNHTARPAPSRFQSSTRFSRILLPDRRFRPLRQRHRLRK